MAPKVERPLRGPWALRGAVLLVGVLGLAAVDALARAGVPTAFASVCCTRRASRGARTRLAARGERSEALWLPDGRLVEAVEELGGRVTRSDLLARGIAAGGLESDLLQLARASGAALQVNGRGELLFEFPSNLPRVLRKRSIALRVQRAWQSATPWLSWAGRVAFGASLVATVAMVYCAVLIVLSTSSSKQEDGDGNRISIVSQNNFAMWFGQDLFFWLMPRPHSYYSYYDGGLLYSEFYKPPPKMSFLESVFSFVFGDGDPNKQLLSETRWQLIGECIAQNGGSVIAEQIAPYLDPYEGVVEGEADEQRALGRAMLPVLLRFDGRPEVGPEGDIVYVFPALQEPRAAGEAIVGGAPTEELRRRLEAVGCPSAAEGREGVIVDYRRAVGQMRRQGASPAEYLPERELRLSEAEEGQVAACVALGALALLGTLYLGSRLGSPHVQLLARVYPLVAFVSSAHPWLLAYTVGFLGIPAWRWLRLGRLNAGVRRRNEWRSRQAAKLRRAGSLLQRKILGAAKWASSRRSFGEAVYSSAEPASARESKSEQDALRSFDERLQDRE